MKKDASVHPFHALLLVAEQRLGGEKQAVAKVLGVTPSRYSRVRGGTGGGMQIENLFRLAQLVQRSPGAVLRACGKESLARLVEEAYGGGGVTATPDQDELIGLWMKVTRADQDAILVLLRALAGVRPATPAPPSAPDAPPPPPTARKRR
jgi:transcriptional regulator with XRE-family HTH domain